MFRWVLNVDVEDGAAHGDGGDRRADRIERLGRHAGDETEAALDQIEDDGATRFVGVIDEAVERHARSRSDGELRLITQHQFRNRIGTRRYDLLLHDIVARREMAQVITEFAGHLVYDGDGGADGVARVGAGGDAKGSDVKAGNEDC